MENIICDYCKKISSESSSICQNCNYPIKGDLKEQSSFRMKLVDVRFWFEGLESPRNLSRILGAVYFILGALLFLILFDDYGGKAIACLTIGSIYIGVYFWSKKDSFTPFIFVPIFYFIHTGIELILDLLPYDILPISIENGWIGVVPIVVSLLPYLYAIFRIALIVVFIKGLINVLKIKNNPKMVERFMKRAR